MSSLRDRFLAQTAASLKNLISRLKRLDGSLVENDIAARRREAPIGLEFAKKVDRIEASGSKLRVDHWCRHVCGCDIGTMRRHKRLNAHWKDYETRHRELRICGQPGLLFALSLVSDQPNSYRNKQSRTTVRSNPASISVKRVAIHRACHVLSSS